jgi:uncharacterized protein YgbK (DUF1537 family)
MPKTLIVADDLSGAADCGIAFGDGVVALSGRGAEAATLAIDADSRSMTQDAAAEITQRLFAHHARAGMLFYKKMDSTLRGHVGAEIAAAQRGLAAFDPVTIVCPAFPAAGRVMKGGRLYVNGTPVEETPIGRELPHGADLAAMLDRAGVKHARIGDAQTQSDLVALVAGAQDAGRTVLWVGSGGLARALAGPAPSAPLAVPPVAGPILFTIGSFSDVSRAQAQSLSGSATLTPLDPAAVMEGRAGLPALAADHVLFLQGGLYSDPHALAQAFADLVAPAAAQAEALFLTGGETARAILGRLGVEGLRLLGEIEPGVIVSRAIGGVLAGRIVVTKAGAFGSPQTLIRVQAILRGRDSGLEIRP